jgi:uracil-DNA glycosylase
VNKLDRLRAYLEQRRELGESELTLDSLAVEDVLRVVGALRAGATSPDAPAHVLTQADDTRASEIRAPAPAREIPREAPDPTDARNRDVPGSASGDWRAVLQGTGANAAMPTPVAPVQQPPRVVTSNTTDAAAASAPRSAGTLSIQIVVPVGLTVERAIPLVQDASAAWATLDDVTAAIRACAACSLASSATHAVPGVGNPTADVMVVGEAPGEKEDLSGEPFVGPAGELLNKILGAIQLDRGSVYVCNVLKHRPPGNRNPLPDEVRACAPFLQRQIDLVQPKMILAFGTFAAQSLLNTKLAIGKLRQQVHRYQGIPLVATYHPAALLRNDAWKRPTWEDVKLARRVLDATIRT